MWDIGVRFSVRPSVRPSVLPSVFPLQFTSTLAFKCIYMILSLIKLPAPGRPTIWITVGQGPTALTVGTGGVCLDIFTLVYLFCPLSPSLWETARYSLKYCLKGPLSPNQPTNQSLIRRQGLRPVKISPVENPRRPPILQIAKPLK